MNPFGLMLLLALAAQAGVAPIRLNRENPHYFEYQGKPIVLITSGEHYGSVLNGAFDYDKYLSTLQKGGLNYTRIFGGSYVEVPAKSFGIRKNTLAPLPGKFVAPWARSSQPGYAGGGNRFDLSRWNPKYFRRLRSFLADAEKRGIIVEITLFSSQYGDAQWALSPFNARNNANHTDPIGREKINTLDNGNLLAYQERYTRKLVREANPFPNVIFEIQNEPWSDHGMRVNVINRYLRPPGRDKFPNSVDIANTTSLAWEKQVAEWIVSEEAKLPNKHLIAQNYSNFLFPVKKTIPGVSIVNFHYAYPEAVALNYHLGKAIAYDESGFLGRSDDAYRRQAWNFMLSGGSTFDGLDYSFTPGHEDGSYLGPNGPGGGSPALRRQLAILHRFLDKLPLVKMIPDTHTVLHATGVEVHLLSSKDGIYAAYLDGNGPSRLTLDLPSGNYRGEWLNTKTGTTTPVAEFKCKNGKEVLDTPAFTNGLALRLRRE
ncbi:MAG: hypothetical protein ACRD45_00255 [Bryobacteraceae bacterium]